MKNKKDQFLFFFNEGVLMGKSQVMISSLGENDDLLMNLLINSVLFFKDQLSISIVNTP